MNNEIEINFSIESGPTVALDLNAPQSPVGAAGGDLAGSFPNPTVIPATFTTAGKIKQTIFNVLDYGAKIDGSTDDTTAINNTIIAASLLGGGFIYIPPGTTMVSTIILLSHTNLVGAGQWATTIKQLSGTAAPVIESYTSPDGIIANAEFVSVRDIKIDGNGNTSTSAHGIYFSTNPANSMATNDDEFDPHHLIKDVFITNCGGWGFYQTGRSEVRVKNVTAGACASGGFSPSYDAFFEGCSAAANGGPGFSFTHGDIMAVDCKSFLSGAATPSNTTPTNQPGFYISDLPAAITLAGCIAQNNNGDGFWIQNSKGVVLAGCVADSNNYGSGNSTSAYTGFNLDNSLHCVVNGVAQQGLQGGIQIGNQMYCVSLINGSNLNNICITTTCDSSLTLLGTYTPQSFQLLNAMVVDGVSQAGFSDIRSEGTTSQNGGRLRFTKIGGTNGGEANIANGAEIGSIDFQGYDGVSISTRQANIAASAAADWSNTSHSTILNFQTTPANSTTPANAFRLLQTQDARFYNGALVNTNLTQNIGATSGYWLNAYLQVLNLNSTASISGATAGILAVTGILKMQGEQHAYVAKTANYTAGANDSIINCTANTFTVTLPTAVGVTGQKYVIKNSGTGTITIATTSSQTIDGATTYSLASQYKYVTVVSNGANWIIVGSN